MWQIVIAGRWDIPLAKTADFMEALGLVALWRARGFNAVWRFSS